MEEKSVSSIYQLSLIALMSAVMCLLGPLSIPIGDVPVTAATLIVYLTVYLLGAKMGTMSCVIYLLLGFVGLPVFSGYTGGAAKLLGPTGGYLVGYLFLAYISGLIIEKFSFKMFGTLIGMILGTVVLYIFGTAWYMILTKCTLVAALAMCVEPFIIGDLAKIVLADLVGYELRKRLKMANLLR